MMLCCESFASLDLGFRVLGRFCCCCRCMWWRFFCVGVGGHVVVGADLQGNFLGEQVGRSEVNSIGGYSIREFHLLRVGPST